VSRHFCHEPLAGDGGRTLLEVMLVLALLVLLAAAAAPRLIGSRRETALRAATRALLAACEHAHNEAVLRARHERVDMDLSAGKYWLTYFDPDQGEYVPDNTSMGQERTIPQTVSFQTVVVGVGAGGPEAQQRREESARRASALARREITFVTFTPQGGADWAAIVLEGEDGAKRTIEVQPLTGRARLVAEEDVPALLEMMRKP